MVIRTIKVNENEAKMIHTGDKRFILRSDKDVFNTGDVINFMVYRDKRPLLNKGENKSYVVTNTYDRGTAPLEKGFQLIAFREVQK